MVEEACSVREESMEAAGREFHCESDLNKGRRAGRRNHGGDKCN